MSQTLAILAATFGLFNLVVKGTPDTIDKTLHIDGKPVNLHLVIEPETEKQPDQEPVTVFTIFEFLFTVIPIMAVVGSASQAFWMRSPTGNGFYAVTFTLTYPVAA